MESPFGNGVAGFGIGGRRRGRPAEGEEADGLDGAGPADDPADGGWADPADPAGAQSQGGGLQDQVFAGDAGIQGRIIDARDQGGEAMGDRGTGDSQGD